MSADFRPKTFKEFADLYGNDYSFYELKNSDGKYVYSRKVRDLVKQFPMLALCSCNIYVTLVKENLIFNDVVKQVEDILNNRPCDNKKLVEMTNLWYNGELVPGYYMDANTEEFLKYIKHLCKQNQSK